MRPSAYAGIAATSIAINRVFVGLPDAEPAQPEISAARPRRDIRVLSLHGSKFYAFGWGSFLRIGLIRRFGVANDPISPAVPHGESRAANSRGSQHNRPESPTWIHAFQAQRARRDGQ
jgi:hypothetical protein